MNVRSPQNMMGPFRVISRGSRAILTEIARMRWDSSNHDDRFATG